jgi:hypothetical protein
MKVHVDDARQNMLAGNIDDARGVGSRTGRKESFDSSVPDQDVHFFDPVLQDNSGPSEVKFVSGHQLLRHRAPTSSSMGSSAWKWPGSSVPSVVTIMVMVR